MALVIGDTGADKGDYELVPAGLQAAVCYAVVDLGMQGDGFETKPKVALCWELNAKDSKGIRFRRWREYMASTNEKATLRKHLESWRGQKFTPEQIKAFDLSKVVGVGCMLNIVHTVSKTNGKTYANVENVMKLIPNVQVAPTTGPRVPKFLLEKAANAAGPTGGEEGFDAGSYVPGADAPDDSDLAF